MSTTRTRGRQATTPPTSVARMAEKLKALPDYAFDNLAEAVEGEQRWRKVRAEVETLVGASADDAFDALAEAVKMEAERRGALLTAEVERICTEPLPDLKIDLGDLGL